MKQHNTNGKKKSSLGEAIRELEDSFIRSKEQDLYRVILEEVEKPLIEMALEKTFGNQLKAARILGINRNTLRTKIRKFGIDVAKWKS